ncbi:MAG: rRNA maturation RNase YbeY [Planctomycetota bacterium]|nr:rRNA maturation RNase YbeY [Planctomycetota bacterium]
MTTAGKKAPKLLISNTSRAMRIPRKRLNRLVAFVAEREAAAISEVDLAIVTRREIAKLNRIYLGRPGATDVLSFDLSDPEAAGISGQIVVCADVAAQRARSRRAGTGPQRELMLYVVHGLLHLMGYDDTSARAAACMHAREDEILNEFTRTQAKCCP